MPATCPGPAAGVLNDNDVSISPPVGALSTSPQPQRLTRTLQSSPASR